MHDERLFEKINHSYFFKWSFFVDKDFLKIILKNA